MEFRSATEDDYPAICKLVKSRDELLWVYPAGRYPLTVSQLKELAQKRSELTVAVEARSLLGFADFYDLEPGRSVFIGNVIVDRKHRGKGIGRALVTFLKDKAFNEYDLPEVRISVFSENRGALLLYNRLGFVPYAVDERVKAGGERLALIHMRLCRTL
jgi:ribosomal protein S18 acetylase RimI-like enzyme